MRYRPCYDIHNGKVKQIVGGSLMDQGDYAKDDYVSEKNGDYYADLYRRAGLHGGHIILLNPSSSEYYKEDVRQAVSALQEYPGGFQIGGGMNADNAGYFLDQGASHIIVTSYVFKDGQVNYDNLNKIFAVTGRDHLVLDLSCRKRDSQYYIVTDRWQKFTEVPFNQKTLEELSKYCDEFLVHAVDVEGKANGIDPEIAGVLGEYRKDQGSNPVTYAGGVGSFDDLKTLKAYGRDQVDVTIGSALDLFGGSMEFERVLEFLKK